MHLRGTFPLGLCTCYRLNIQIGLTRKKGNMIKPITKTTGNIALDKYAYFTCVKQAEDHPAVQKYRRP